MKLNAPKVITWWIALILAVVGIIMHAGWFNVSFIPISAFVLEAISAVLLIVATKIKFL